MTKILGACTADELRARVVLVGFCLSVLIGLALGGCNKRLITGEMHDDLEDVRAGIMKLIVERDALRAENTRLEDELRCRRPCVEPKHVDDGIDQPRSCPPLGCHKYARTDGGAP